MSYVTTHTICKKEVTLDVTPETSVAMVQAGAKVGDEYGITFHNEPWLNDKWIIVKIQRRTIHLERNVPVGIVEWCPLVTSVRYGEGEIKHKRPKYLYFPWYIICEN